MNQNSNPFSQNTSQEGLNNNDFLDNGMDFSVGSSPVMPDKKGVINPNFDYKNLRSQNLNAGKSKDNSFNSYASLGNGSHSSDQNNTHFNQSSDAGFYPPSHYQNLNKNNGPEKPSNSNPSIKNPFDISNPQPQPQYTPPAYQNNNSNQFSNLNNQPPKKPVNNQQQQNFFPSKSANQPSRQVQFSSYDSNVSANLNAVNQPANLIPQNKNLAKPESKSNKREKPQRLSKEKQKIQKPEVDKNSPDYLRSLTSSQLRQEVVKTESEIQKQLIETEKAYRKGISTIRDLIAPSSIKVSTGMLEIGTKLVRSFFVLTYPRVIVSGWLEAIVNADIPFDLSIFIYPRDSGEVLKELKSKVGKIQASLQINSDSGSARDPALETAYQDVESLRDAIQQGVEKFFRVGVYVTVYADNIDMLNKYSQTVEGLLSQQNIILKRAALQMDDGFNSSLPIMKDDLNVFNNLNTSPLSACFPFVSSELSSDAGILYGINRHNTSLIIFDRFELENANSIVLATSGSGKSYAVKLEILRSLMLGVDVIVIDPEQEYKTLTDSLGGAYINMSLNSPNRINPFDLPKPLPGESNNDILRSAIIDMMGLMNLMLGKLDPQETSIMEQAIKESYAKRDINQDSDFSNVTVPTMSDLVEILNGIVGGEALAQRLYTYTEGTFAGIFNQRTNINVNNSLVVYNIRDLQDQLRPIAMYVLLKHIWNEIRSELKRRILTIDEAWIMMQYEDSAKFLNGLAKRARKYYLGITTITQDVGDFLNSPYGKPIVTNSAMKLLLKQSSAAIDMVGDIFALTRGERQVLLNSEVGQGIFFAGPRHVAIEIIGFPTEHRLITTNPKDILGD